MSYTPTTTSLAIQPRKVRLYSIGFTNGITRDPVNGTPLPRAVMRFSSKDGRSKYRPHTSAKQKAKLLLRSENALALHA